MKLRALYDRYLSGKISIDQFAEELNLTTRGLKIRLTKWGDRFGTLMTTLDELGDDTINTVQASERLGTTTREINQLRESYSVGRPIRDYIVSRASSSIKWERYKKHAVDYIAGRRSLQQASDDSGLSVLGMRKWINKMLDRHTQLTWREHADMSLKDQQAIAKKIEEVENLSIQAQMISDAISLGRTTVQEQAIARAQFLKEQREQLKKQKKHKKGDEAQ
jgi:hypothetical protein